MSHRISPLLKSLAALAATAPSGCALVSDDGPSNWGYRPLDEWAITIDPARACDAFAAGIRECTSEAGLCVELCGAGADVMCRLEEAYLERATKRDDQGKPPCPSTDEIAPVTLWCGRYEYGPVPASYGRCSAVAGRRPAGLRLPPPAALPGDELGDYFADCARLEAASVDAFVALGDELRAHGAPPALIDAAARAADDERRHTALMAGLAAKYGSKARAPEVDPVAPRTLAELAAENVVEGVVRETFGALVALWQARHARDAEVRDAMRQIADDECEHAALAWDVAAWARERLDPRVDLRPALASAVETLAGEATRAPARALREVAGLPSAGEARGLLALLGREAWAGLLRAEAAALVYRPGQIAPS